MSADFHPLQYVNDPHFLEQDAVSRLVQGAKSRTAYVDLFRGLSLKTCLT